ncbi:hypothetical protein TL18_03760 [Methanobrevibacter sp. YE315]|uniref:hypothetical protein n=1 Tax=Methanobrevibacter sp. YE315 TaxID=1609968 RepID=UPI000764DBB4|nr:hypothetical protein [Methanobrevibacter sp. YE315]AMD17214.1 hypothetical protein TL18_03760 [Methanobrevibacter sp. YE315]
MLFLCILIGTSCVSASDVDTMPLNEPTHINHTLTDETPLPGNFDDLNNDIQNLQPGDTYDFDKDYYFDGNGKHIIIDENVIIIDKDNITINGNGHIIDAGEYFYAIFKVTGNNVKLLNLTIINSKPIGINIPDNSPMDDSKYRKTYHDVLSPISWNGDYGIISDCTFINNEAINGGAVSWSGNNGIINNCIFINNTARGIGGAIYIGGADNTISHSFFINSFSQLSHEAIYIDRNKKNLNLTECVFEEGGKYIIDGSVTNIDVNYLRYDFSSYLIDKKFNLAHVMYSAIMNSGLNYLDNDIVYYIIYDNETCTFSLSMIRYFEEYGITYRKDYNFKNITELNEIFNLMREGNFRNDLTLMLNKTVSSTADYNALIKSHILEISFAFEERSCPDFEGYLPLENLLYVLNVIFTSNVSIRCTDPWQISFSQFNMIIINGHQSTIYGTYDESDEYHWLVVDPSYSIVVSNLNIEGYNTAVYNMGGSCTFNNVIFKNNRMDYIITRDWGGAIINLGSMTCNNCSFISNYAKHGGAIFNQGALVLNNCTFSNNKAYGKGNDVCVGDGGKVQFKGINLTGDCGPVYFSNGFSMTDISLITAWCIGSTILLSILAGAASGGMLMAASLGLAIGAIHGILAAKLVSDNVFNVNFDTTIFSAVIIGGSIMAGIAAEIFGFAFLSEANCCDFWLLRHIDGPDYIFVDDASSLSSGSASVLSNSVTLLSDSASVISAMLP